MIDVKVEVELSLIRILIDGLLHFSVRRPELIAVHSYKNGHKSYIIEYETISKTILTEYDRSDLWASILTGLGEHQLF